MLAPVYDIYESKTRVVVVGPKQDQMKFRNASQIYDISRGFARAADVLARAVEAEYGCQRLWPDVLGIRILHLKIDGQLVNEANLGHAFLGEYHW